MALQFRAMGEEAAKLRARIDEAKKGADADLRLHLEKCDRAAVEIEVRLAMCLLMHERDGKAKDK